MNAIIPRVGVTALELDSYPEDPRARGAVERAVALDLGVSLGAARTFLSRLPARYPRAFALGEEANEVAARLQALGVSLSRVTLDISPTSCATHPHLWGHLRCARCDAPSCSLCARVCGACANAQRRSRRFFYVRVSVLLAILFGVLLYAWGDVRRRELRTDWTRTLRVALIVVPLEPLDARVVSSLPVRARVLEERLATEMKRYRRGPRPFDIEIATASHGGPPPAPPSDPNDWVGTVAYNWYLSRWVAGIDEQARVDPDALDARIYVVAKPGGEPGSLLTVEGTGQQGGRLGVVQIDLDASMVDIALFVAAHELFHVLGASDKYAPDGSVLVPEGLADPNRVPLFPQLGAELMARHRPVSARESVMPQSLDELAVGPGTAREVRWLPDR